jgi:hypothetical protein
MSCGASPVQPEPPMHQTDSWEERSRDWRATQHNPSLKPGSRLVSFATHRDSRQAKVPAPLGRDRRQCSGVAHIQESLPFRTGIRTQTPWCNCRLKIVDHTVLRKRPFLARGLGLEAYWLPVPRQEFVKVAGGMTVCSATIWMGTQRQSGWPFRRSRREDDCRGATITQAIFA